MTQYRKMECLSIGDFVLSCDGFFGTIVRLEPLRRESYIMKPFGDPAPWRSYELSDLTAIVCNACNQVRSAHADTGRCLYGPGSWEALWPYT